MLAGVSQWVNVIKYRLLSLTELTRASWLQRYWPRKDVIHSQLLIVISVGDPDECNCVSMLFHKLTHFNDTSILLELTRGEYTSVSFLFLRESQPGSLIYWSDAKLAEGNGFCLSYLYVPRVWYLTHNYGWCYKDKFVPLERWWDTVVCFIVRLRSATYILKL